MCIYECKLLDRIFCYIWAVIFTCYIMLEKKKSNCVEIFWDDFLGRLCGNEICTVVMNG